MAWDKSNKCSCCGYKFKKGDGSICPECLTSREETMSCNDLTSDLHSHKKGFVNEREGMTEVEKQLEQERQQSYAEKNSRSKTNSNSTVGFNRAFSSSSQKMSGNKSLNSDKGFLDSLPITLEEEMKQNRLNYNKYKNIQTLFSLNNNRAYGQNENQRKPKSIIIKIIIAFFIMSVVSTVVPLFAAFNWMDDNDYSYNSNIDYTDYGFELKEYGEKVYTNNCNFIVYTPTLTDETPDTEDYLDNINTSYTLDTGKYVIMEVPVTICNDTTEEMRISDIYTYIETTVYDTNTYIDETYESFPYDYGYSANVIPAHTTITASIKYVVPKSYIEGEDYYKIVIHGQYNQGEYSYYYIYEPEDYESDV